MGPHKVLRRISSKNKVHPTRPSSPTSTPTSISTKDTSTQNIVKKAILIGINYTGSQYQLEGCINDSFDLQDLLLDDKFFNKQDIILMNDNSTGSLYPSKSNILAQLQNLVALSNKSSTTKYQFLIAYSGHGSSQIDRNNAKNTGKDELLCPIDFSTGGFIVDFDIKNNFVDKLSKNTSCTFLVDACHSGTIIDLKYNYLFSNSSDEDKIRVFDKITDTKCQAVLISGCTDSQTSADAQVDGKAQGAMTASFLATYNTDISYRDLVLGMRRWLAKNKYEQIPQLSTGQAINDTTKFLLDGYDD